ncbi:MAG: hypothetical protein U0531_20220 [Dehalococcoidia bacterium]
MVAEWARRAVPLYRDLYAAAPAVLDVAAFRRLPPLTAARLRATPLIDQIDDPNDTLRTFTPYLLQTAESGAPLLMDADDADAHFEQTRDALALAGVRRGATLLVLTPPEQRYVAAELSDLLGYFGIRVHVLVRRPGAALVRSAAALAPDGILGLGRDLPPALRPSLTVRDPGGTAADLYLVPPAGIVAVRRAGEPSYRVLTKHVLIEARPGGALLLTALRRFHQPLVRLLLPDRGRVVRGRLWLDEVAP